MMPGLPLASAPSALTASPRDSANSQPLQPPEVCRQWRRCRRRGPLRCRMLPWWPSSGRRSRARRRRAPPRGDTFCLADASRRPVVASGATARHAGPGPFPHRPGSRGCPARCRPFDPSGAGVVGGQGQAHVAVGVHQGAHVADAGFQVVRAVKGVGGVPGRGRCRA